MKNRHLDWLVYIPPAKKQLVVRHGMTHVWVEDKSIIE